MEQKIYMNYIHPSSLLRQLSELWKDNLLCDAVITVDNVIIEKAHKVVLFAVSPKVKADSSNCSQQPILDVCLPTGISHRAVHAFLQYIYEGYLILTKQLAEDLRKIAQFLEVKCLANCCTDFLSSLEKKENIIVIDESPVELKSEEFNHVRTSAVENVANSKRIQDGCDEVPPRRKKHRISDQTSSQSSNNSTQFSSPSVYDRGNTSVYTAEPVLELSAMGTSNSNQSPFQGIKAQSEHAYQSVQYNQKDQRVIMDPGKDVEMATSPREESVFSPIHGKSDQALGSDCSIAVGSEEWHVQQCKSSSPADSVTIDLDETDGQHFSIPTTCFMLDNDPLSESEVVIDSSTRSRSSSPNQAPKRTVDILSTSVSDETSAVTPAKLLGKPSKQIIDIPSTSIADEKSTAPPFKISGQPALQIVEIPGTSVFDETSKATLDKTTGESSKWTADALSFCISDINSLASDDTAGEKPSLLRMILDLPTFSTKIHLPDVKTEEDARLEPLGQTPTAPRYSSTTDHNTVSPMSYPIRPPQAVYPPTSGYGEQTSPSNLRFDVSASNSSFCQSNNDDRSDDVPDEVGPASQEELQDVKMESSDQTTGHDLSQVLGRINSSYDGTSCSGNPNERQPRWTDSEFEDVSAEISKLPHLAHEVRKYTAAELLSKKGMRQRPTMAQHTGLTLVRHAATMAGIWIHAPLLKDITQEQVEKFNETLIAVAPQLSPYMHECRKKLGEQLQNRRKYLLDKQLGRNPRHKPKT